MRAIQAGDLAADARLLVGNRRETPAFGWVDALGIPSLFIPTAGDPEGADIRLAEALGAHGVDLVVLSGYLRRLGPETLRRYEGRILNIHPGPLPAFGGEGMYGINVHRAVIAAGVAESGMTIHLVDEEYDHGAVVARRAVPVRAGETAADLEARVKALEPPFFVDVLRSLADGDLTLPSSLRRFG